MAYPMGYSHKPRVSYAVARVLLGLDEMLANDPDDALNRADCTPEEAGLEEDQEQPVFGLPTRRTMHNREGCDSGVYELTEWYADGDAEAFAAI